MCTNGLWGIRCPYFRGFLRKGLHYIIFHMGRYNTLAFESSPGNGDCCNGKCVCHFDENGNQYRSDGTNDLNCRCEPAEVVCQPVSRSELYNLQKKGEKPAFHVF